MNRRSFLRSAAAAASSAAFAKVPNSTGWRTFEVVTRVEVLKSSEVTRVWLPAALITPTPFQKTLSNRFSTEGRADMLVEDKRDALGVLVAGFPSGEKPALTLTSRVALRNISVDFFSPGRALRPDHAELEHFLRPTKLIPTNGIVKETSTQITRGAKTDVQKARAIYEWIVENTFRNPKVRGCGVGDIRFMLESKDLSGKCADINTLFVGLSRAAGLPARDVYGIRVAKSDLGYKCLGPSSDNITKAQHCRAEVYLETYGWVPVDPADVRKVMLEEPPGKRQLEDPMVTSARSRLFGSWEMNWMAYNFAHDVTLPNSTRPPLGFLMYPQAETPDGRLDSLDPDNFKYDITSREI